jgi:hypothetical protein
MSPSKSLSLSFALSLTLTAGCPGSSSPSTDAGRDAFAAPDASTTPDAFVSPDAFVTPDVGTDAPACGHPVGERFSAGDACNFCECTASGGTTCTNRVCHESIGGCTYAGTMHDYGARFPSSDGCNECVCAASGLACTTRASCTDVPNSAILLESPDDACGTNPTFTPRHVLDTLPTTDFTAPFHYDRARPVAQYPESLPDTNVRIRVVFDGGFMVCRIPMPTQPSLDLQVTVEWITEDGAFDEGFPAYLRRNDFGFLDAFLIDASAPLGGLHGSYSPNCALDPGGYSFDAQIEPNGHATGSAHRICETDLYLTIGDFDRAAP